MSRSADEICEEFLGQLLPQGEAWPKDGPSNLRNLLWALASPRARLESDIEGLAAEISPGTSVQLLTDYESIVGRTCCDAQSSTLTLAQRQAIAQARWVGRKVVSRQDYIDLAAQMGFEITIEEYTPAYADFMCAEDPCRGEDWAFCWLVRSPGYTPIYFMADQSSAEDPLMSWGNSPLKCEITARNPAHLTVRFGQSGANVVSDFGKDIR